MKIYAAPLQGYTHAAWRRHHAEVFGGIDAYYTPFMRVERGETRRRDIADIAPANNPGIEIVPQAIFRDTDEFRLIARAAAGAGHTRLDLNLGCPFPPQTRHGRGAALIRRPDLLAETASIAAGEFPGLRLSVKTRLGLERPDEWRGIIDTLNAMPLDLLAVHPRVATQQYGGELYTREFGDLLAASAHPVVFNGDVFTPADIDRVAREYPAIAGVMAGRGLLARPSLAAEWRDGALMPQADLAAGIMDLHNLVLADFEGVLCGEAQILSKIKPFWDYFTPDDIFPRKFLKQLHKATSLAKYSAALAAL